MKWREPLKAEALYAHRSFFFLKKRRCCSHWWALICTSNTFQGFATTSGVVKLICCSVEELEEWKQPGKYESRVKTQSRNASHKSLLRANPCHCPRCCHYFKSLSSATQKLSLRLLSKWVEKNTAHHKALFSKAGEMAEAFLSGRLSLHLNILLEVFLSKCVPAQIFWHPKKED